MGATSPDRALVCQRANDGRSASGSGPVNLTAIDTMRKRRKKTSAPSVVAKKPFGRQIGQAQPRVIQEQLLEIISGFAG
jgi:hypothetical protein